MELDDLKASWQQENTDKTRLKQKNMEQLQIILNKKTSGIMQRVKSKYEFAISVLLIGVFLNVLISPFLHWLLGEPGPVFRMPDFKSLSSLFVVVLMFVVVLFFYWIKYTSVQTQVYSDDIKLTLLENIKKLKKSFRQEVFFLISFFVVFFIIARLHSQILGNGDFWDIFRKDILLSMLLSVTFFAVLIYRRAKHYYKNIKEFESYLSEYNEASTIE